MTTRLRLAALLRNLLLAMPLLVIAWLAVLAFVMRLGGAAPAALTLFPSSALLAGLGDDVDITSATLLTVTLRSDSPDLVAQLYASGAWLVLPAGLERCLPE